MQNLNVQKTHQVAGAEGYKVNVMAEVPLSYILSVVEQLHNVTETTFVDLTKLELAILNAGLTPSQITTQVNVVYTTYV